jgi:hypothetical protein
MIVLSIVLNVHESECQETSTPVTPGPSTVSPSTMSPSISPSSNETSSPTSVNDTIDWEYENIVALRWKIQNPPTVSYSGLQFDLHFTVSDYVEAQHVRYDLYEGSSCDYVDGLITELGYIDVWVTEDSTPAGGGIGTRIITLSNKLNPTNITESNIYKETGNNAQITYCARFSLWTAGASDLSATEVNSLAVTITLSVNLNDDFSISGQSVEARERLVETTDDEFFVEAFLCNEFGERPRDVFPYLQGQAVFVCVQPTRQAYDVGFRMRRIDKFTFVQGYTTQEAIINQEVSANGLTELWCDPGVDQCMFETLLFAYFFQSAQSSVGGTGVASLQWTSARRLEDGVADEGDGDSDDRRQLQESSKHITIPIFSVQAVERGPREEYSSIATEHESRTCRQLSFAVVLIASLVSFIL